MTKNNCKRVFHYLGYLKNLNLNDDTKYLKECDVLFFCHDVDRPLTLSGKAYSPLADSIRDDFEKRGFKCMTIAHYGSLLTGEKGYGFPISINRKHLIYFVITKLISLFNLSQILKCDNVYGYVLDRTKAKLVIAIGSRPMLCFESRRRNVFHVELLHGMGYCFIPWGWDKQQRNFLPSGILSLDDISTRSFSPLAGKGIRTFTIPNPFLKRFLPDKLNLIPNEWKPDYEQSGKYKKSILVSMVWGYAGDHGSLTEFENILTNGLFYDEISKIVEDERDIFWRFRFHPVQMRLKKYQKLHAFMDDFVSMNPNSDWKESSALPFQSVVSMCHGNISMMSMSSYDAAAMGVQTLLLCPTIQPGGIHQDWFEDLVKEGYVTKNRINVVLLQNWVRTVEKIEPRLSNLSDEESWNNAVDWMLSEGGLKNNEVN